MGSTDWIITWFVVIAVIGASFTAGMSLATHQNAAEQLVVATHQSRR